MKKLSIIYLTVFWGISCTQIDLEQPGSRFLSNAITCETDRLCFSRVDSLLWKDGEPAWAQNLEWRELSRADTIINFHEYSEAGDSAAILVLDNYEAEEAGKYILRLGSDDGFRIFVNGEEIASRIIGRALQLDSDWIPIHLNKGNNRLIIQVNQGTGDWKLHYKIDKGEHLKELVEDQLIEIYRDLPDLNILSDTSTVLVLNKDPRQNLVKWHSISYEWKNPESGKKIAAEHHNASKAPQTFRLPENPVFPLLFKYSVRDDNEQEFFSETIPIFSKKTVEEYVQDAHGKLSSEPGKEQWTHGLELVFPEYLGLEQTQSYSTRIKTEFLWDALMQAGHQFYTIGGPRMTDVKGSISRVYQPDITVKNQIKVIAINPQPDDSVDHYLSTYYGHTHHILRVRSSYPRYFGMELTFPFIQQHTENNNTGAVLNYYTNALDDSSSFNIMAWSNSVPPVLEELGSRSFPVKNAALLKSYISDQPTERFLTIQNIKKYNPQIEWYIWHGEEDERVPIGIAENWAEAFRKQGFTVHYERLPLTDHQVYFIDPTKKFLRYITKGNSN